ncbi:MAG: FAD-dependent oxidoreductase [Defluviicoccus sp.]|nr:FAD-dependent oxidoreductase [Defluviicoccus sp.]
MTSTVSKREFLQTLGAAAGVGAVWRGMEALGLARPGVASAAPPELPPGSGAGRSVAILGAGIAGMAAAYELARAGWRCTILEAAGRAGGRNLTVRAGDTLEEIGSRQRVRFSQEPHLYANLGAARIPHHHRTVLSYCKAFGVELEVFTNDNRAALYHDPERFGGRTVTARRAVSDIRGYIAEMLAKAVSAASLDSALTAGEKKLLVEMLADYGDLDDGGRYRGSARGGYRGRVNAGLRRGEPEDRLDFAELLRSRFWRHGPRTAESLNQNPTLLQPVGGMDAIASAFEARVGGLIRFGRVVERIERTGRGVRIVHRAARSGARAALEADFAICTVPAPVLKDIAGDFAPETRAAIASAAFGNAVKIAFQTRRRFWEDDLAIYGGISWTGQDIAQIWYPPYGYHRDRGVILGAYIWGRKPGLRFQGMRPEARLAAAIAQGERVHPGYADEIEAGVSRAWGNVPFQLGAWPEADEAPAALQRPDGAVHFAGDQASALPGWQEGAVLSAHAAVAAIARRAAGR